MLYYEFSIKQFYQLRKHNEKMIFGLITIFSFVAQATVVDGWDVRLSKPIEIKPALVMEEEVETYSGDFMIVSNEQKPPKGYVYAIVSPIISKKNASAPFFNPQDLTLKINNQIIARVSEDNFLYDYKMIPLTHLLMKLGTHKGDMIFQIPASSQNDKIILMYKNNPIAQGD